MKAWYYLWCVCVVAGCSQLRSAQSRKPGDASRGPIMINETQIAIYEERGLQWLIPLSPGQTISNGTTRALYVTDAHVLLKERKEIDE